MLTLFKDTAVLACKRAAAGWLVAVALVFYVFVFLVAYRLIGGIGGFVGGIIVALVLSACLSGYFYFLSQAVQGLKLRVDDFKRGFGALFGDVLSVMFALWILGFLAGAVVMGAGPNGEAIAVMISLTMAFFFNPLPELTYLGSSRSFQLLMESARFVLANPVAWFLPNLILAALFLAPTGALAVDHPGKLLQVFSELFSWRGVLASFAQLPPWSWALMLVFFHWAMVFRGLLFQALSTGNPRRREWQARLRP